MRLGRDLCGDFETALEREWLVTNGLGGYACGTVALANSRRYHAFLMASLDPPVERTLLVAKIEVIVAYRGERYALSSNEFADGAVDPRGFLNIESFAVEDGIPVWRFAIADALLEQRIFMAPGANTSFLTLTLRRGAAPLSVEMKPLVAYRPLHAHERGGRAFRVEAGESVCTVRAPDGARPFHLSVASGRFAPLEAWYWRFRHREEAARGLDALEDLYVPGVFSAQIGAPGDTLALVASVDEAAPAGEPAAAGEAPPAGALPAGKAPPAGRAGTLVERAAAALIERSRRLQGALPPGAPAWIKTLAIASDQFLVRRGDPGRPGASSIIAGYPWFADWGRDTMISLPGLATALGRYEVAADLLRTYAKFVDRGMLPNRFPDEGAVPEYNTADATLWMFHALEDYLAARRDADLARELFPTLAAIVHAHVDGTRYGIEVDPRDGLLRAGEPGIQLTWMDAKQGGQVFTPRVGKPVEINALWLNALEVTARLADRVRDVGEKRYCESLLERAAAGFARFWNPQRGHLNDVLDVDGGEGVDAALRPNQLFAVSLPYSALPTAQMRAVVESCARELLTSYGLRSLSPADAHYLGRYRGDVWQRDAAYHQGTVWAWLKGPFARAHYRVYGDARLAQSFLTPFSEHLQAACLGTISEIFEGDAPHSACGCFAQAWSVAEILRTWIALERESGRRQGQR